MRMTGVRGTLRGCSLLAQGVVFALCGLGAASSAKAQTAQASQGTSQGVPLDRLVAVVNETVILESDVDQELRMAAFRPLLDVSRNVSREQLLERLINRTLILQQAHLQPEEEITDQQVAEQFVALRKDIPACKTYHCETDAGWEKFVADQGCTIAELTKYWRERMEVLRFIEDRFRSGIEINQDEIREYYEKTLLPQYASEHATAPKLETISNRIQEILLQQRVNSLLADWLKSLRAQGTVRTIQTDEATP